MTEPAFYNRTMGVHPVGIGFGWVVCEGPFKLIEAGLFTPVRKEPHRRSIRHLERLLGRFLPAELVLEAFDPTDSRRSERARDLGLEMVSIAADRELSVEGYPRKAIQQTFAKVGATTREEIAAVVAQRFPALAYRLPKERQAWDGEDRRLAMFSAAAVVMAHFDYGATALLNDVRNAA